ncbi:MAG: ThuA domain-containing protein [Alphaproteobacteria bacterium]|nr:ThuA domain-containing protein [Alphaproteobacteria bacterium]
MANSLGLILAGGKLRVPWNAVNREDRRQVRWGHAALLAVGVSVVCSSIGNSADPRFTVLVFSKTAGFRHDSIPQGVAAIEALGAEHGFAVDETEDAARFSDAALARYRVIVFLNTTGDVLDAGQKAAFEGYMRSGGGFVGIHSAADTEYGWPWYGGLIGAWFKSHPQIQRATVHVADPRHPSMKDLPAAWERTDEWYNFRTNPRGAVRVLATLDEATYSGGTMGADHPIAWCQEVKGGRSWYTGMGHTKESYAEPLFRLHLLGGMESAAGIAGSCKNYE